MKHPIPISVVLILSAALVACSAPIGALGTAVPPVASAEPSFELGSPDPTPAPSATSGAGSSPSSPSPEPIPSPDPTAAPSPSGTTTVRAYFMLGGPFRSAGLVPVLRRIPATTAVARAAMNVLLDGPNADERGASPAISSTIPAETKLLGLSLKDGVATVDLSAAFEPGGDLESRVGRIGQVVYTLTQFSTIESVAFRLDGHPVTAFGPEGIVLHGPVSRAELVETGFEGMFESVLPAVFVDGPAWGATLGNPGRVRGTANTYEAWLMVTLYDASGRQLYESQATATCGTACRGTFDITVSYDLSNAQWGTLRVLDGDESGETDGVSREYPVWLTAGSSVEHGPCGC
jgi:Sporulation and spore germination/Immunoglobulin-like domain of bacterial spore germination